MDDVKSLSDIQLNRAFINNNSLYVELITKHPDTCWNLPEFQEVMDTLVMIIAELRHRRGRPHSD